MASALEKIGFSTNGLKVVNKINIIETQCDRSAIATDQKYRKIYTIELYYADMPNKITMRYICEEQRDIDYAYIVDTLNLKNNTLGENNEN